MRLTYLRSSVDGTIVTGDSDDPSFRAMLQTRRSDRPDRILYEFAMDAVPGVLAGVELARREAIVARVHAATGATVTVTDYLGTGEATNDRAAELLDQAVEALAPVTVPGFAAFAGEIPVPPAIPSPGPGSFG